MSEIAFRIQKAKDDLMAMNDIIKEYQPFIASVTSKVCKRQVVYGFDDELNVAMIGFHEAARSYSAKKGTFMKYAEVVMSSRVIDYLRKQQRHDNVTSLNETSEDKNVSLQDKLVDKGDDYAKLELKEAVASEIAELQKELAMFDVSFEDLVGSRPKQERTIAACEKVARFACENKGIILNMKETKRVPVATICEQTGIERKTVERHRKYIVALLVIYSNGYEIIRNHLKQVLIVRNGGESR